MEDDDSGNSTGKFPFPTTCSIPFRNVDVLELWVKLKFLGISTDYGSSSPESIHGHYPSQHKDTTTLLTIKQETSESLLMGQMSSPENHSSSGQLSDSYYSNESSNSTPDTERSGSKKTAYNEKWGVKVLKGKY